MVTTTAVSNDATVNPTPYVTFTAGS